MGKKGPPRLALEAFLAERPATRSEIINHVSLFVPPPLAVRARRKRTTGAYPVSVSQQAQMGAREIASTVIGNALRDGAIRKNEDGTYSLARSGVELVVTEPSIRSQC